MNYTPAGEWNVEVEADMEDYLGRLACDAENDPYVARALLKRVLEERRLKKEGKRDYHDSLIPILQKRSCAGVKGFTDEEKAAVNVMLTDKQ